MHANCIYKNRWNSTNFFFTVPRLALVMKHFKKKIQLFNELHKSIRRNFPRRGLIIKERIRWTMASDLAQMSWYPKSKKNFKFLLVMIDWFCKYLWAQQLQSKSAKKLFKATKKTPQRSEADWGKKYFNVHFRKVMQ